MIRRNINYFNNVSALIVLFITCVIIYYLIYKTNEDFNTVSNGVLTNEGVQVMGSILNSGSGTIDNLTILGSLKIGNTTIDKDGAISIGEMTSIDKYGQIMIKGPNSKYYLHTEGDVFVIRNSSSKEDSRYAFGPDGYIDMGKDIAASNIRVSGNLTVGQDLILDGKNKWIIHTPDTNSADRLYIAPMVGSDWVWSAGLTSAPGIPYDNKRASDGSDIAHLGVANSYECASKCSSMIGATRALYKKNSNECWCKNNDINSWQGDDTNYITYNFS